MKIRFGFGIILILVATMMYAKAEDRQMDPRDVSMQQSKLSDIQLADYYYNKHNETLSSNPISAIADLKKAASYYLKATQMHKAASTLAEVGQIYTNLNMHYLALEYLLEVDKMLSGQPHSLQAAWLCSDIGNVYFAMEQIDLAEPYYWRGMKVMDELKDIFGQSVMLNNIGMCKMKQGNPSAALEYFNKSLALRKSTNNRFTIYHSFNFLAEANKAIGNTSLSEEYYLKIYNDLVSPAEPFNSSQALRASSALALYEICLGNNNPIQAEQYIDAAISIISTIHDAYRLNSVLLKKAEYLRGNRRLSEATTALENVFKSASENGFIDQAKQSSQHLVSIYLEMNKLSKAQSFWQSYIAYSDSMFATQSPDKFIRLHSSVQNNLKDLENKELKHRQHSNLILLFTTIISLLIIVLLLAKAFYDDKKHIKRLHQLADASFEGIIVHDKGVVKEVNKVFLEMLDISREECIGKPITNVASLTFEEKIKDHIKMGGIQNYELEVHSPTKGTMFLEVQSRPYTFVNSQVRVAAIRNITERKQFVKSLIDAQIQLRELNSTKDKLLSVIAHDLKNPFSAIMGFSEVMRDNLDKFSQEQIHEMISMVHDTSTSAHNMLQNLLEWARIQIGASPFHPHHYDIQSAIAEAVSLAKAHSSAKAINISITCPSKTMVYADRNMLAMILNNLISNAIKFTQNHGSITIAVHQKDATILEVIDSGIGMDEEQISDLFKIENINSRSGTNNERGTGIGLILCKEVIDLHGGSISVESRVGQGSCFTVIFPKPVSTQLV